MKIIQIVATRCPILRLKRNKFNFGWGSAPADPAGELTALPRPLPGFNGPTSKGREGERWKWRERKGPLYFFSANLMRTITIIRGKFPVVKMLHTSTNQANSSHQMFKTKPPPFSPTLKHAFSCNRSSSWRIQCCRTCVQSLIYDFQIALCCLFSFKL